MHLCHLGRIARFITQASSYLGGPRSLAVSAVKANEKSYITEQIDGLKRVFEAHGMIVTGPPLDLDSNRKQEKTGE